MEQTQEMSWTEVNCGGPKWTDVVYLLKQEGQELDELVGRQRLHIGLLKAAQVLVFGLRRGKAGGC